MVADALAARGRSAPGRETDGAWTGEARLGGQDVLLVKPLTFMNRSGQPVARLLAEQGGKPEDLIVLLDDVVLELGVLRVRERGSHGGHNGLRSVIESLESEEVPRLRIGIRKGEPPEDLADYVLSPFPEDDVLVVQEVVGRAADAVECMIAEGTAAAMNRFNGPRKALE
jgi:PTH1 family peptidyl-tRNA hydrolase